MSEYNGWTNRATWLVNVWYNPESKEELDSIKDDLMEELISIPDGVLKDMIDLSDINWKELAEHLE